MRALGATKINEAVRILGVPRDLRRSFSRALALSGVGSQSLWIQTQMRRFVNQQQKRFGVDLFRVLTAEEEFLLEVIASGAAEVQQIAEESMMTETRIAKLLVSLIDFGYVEERRKGGKTEVARGAAIRMYLITPKYEEDYADRDISQSATVSPRSARERS